MKGLWTDVGAMSRLAHRFLAAEQEDRLITEAQPAPEPPVFSSAGSSAMAYRVHSHASPAYLSSGDFSDSFTIDQTTLVLAVADVSGKGVHAALLNGVAHSLLRRIAATERAPVPVLNRLNDILNGSRLGSMYMTIFLGFYHIASGRLRYASAGHPVPMRSTVEGNVSPVGRATGPILGILDAAVWEEDEILLLEGDRLIVYTDGAIEAKDRRGRFLGERRLINLLRHHAAMNIDRMCEAVSAAIDDYQGGRRHDDMTLLALERRLG